MAKPIRKAITIPIHLRCEKITRRYTSEHPEGVIIGRESWTESVRLRRSLVKRFGLRRALSIHRAGFDLSVEEVEVPELIGG